MILDAVEDDTVLSFIVDEICLREQGGHALYKSLKSKTTMHNLLHAALPKQKLGWNVIGELSKLFLAECVCLRSLDISYCSLLPDERATVQNVKALEQLIFHRESKSGIRMAKFPFGEFSMRSRSSNSAAKSS